MSGRGLAAALLSAPFLAGCSGVLLSPSGPVAAPSTTHPVTTGERQDFAYPPRSELFHDLAGWAEDDHVAALAAFRAGCHAKRDPARALACDTAESSGGTTEAAARLFFERFFRPRPATTPGLLTAYFTPIYEARARPGGIFTAPVRPRPADLPPSDTSPTAAAPYPDRAEIETRAAPHALAWMRPEDLFVLQIQGSGVLVFPGGVRAKAIFDGSNGAPFRGIGAPLRQMGLLADNDTSGEAIWTWLAAHRGPAADAVMRLNPRYVFFRLGRDDGVTPTGAAGVALIPGRSVAVDPTRHAMGDLLWIDASAPALTGAFPVYRRLAVALDTGGAIRGEGRADLYLGEGAAAALEAGRVRHVLRLYRLDPVPPPAP